MEKKKSAAEEGVYVRIGVDDAVESKKELLEITASIINMQMLNEKIKDYGKTEVRQMAGAKSDTRAMQLLVNRMTSDLPKVRAEHVEHAAHAEVKAQVSQTEGKPVKEKMIKSKEKALALKVPKTRKSALNQELLDIKRRLANLS